MSSKPTISKLKGFPVLTKRDQVGISIITVFVFCNVVINFRHVYKEKYTSVLRDPTPDNQKCEKLPQHGGDCQILGPRRPAWDCYDLMRKSLPEFLKVYANRPIKPNASGMRVEHSFAMWYTLRNQHPQPTTIIESGIFRGHSTWLIQQTLPGVRIISLDPEDRILYRGENVMYLTGKMFVDFKNVSWQDFGLDFDRTIVLLDDHQSAFRRVIEEGRQLGFWRYMIDDNSDFLEGDNYSFKWVCEVERRDLWHGKIPDNFGRSITNMSWEEHEACGEEIRKYVRLYYEFPPIACADMVTEARNDKYRATPLYCNSAALARIGFEDYDELRNYGHFAYVELTK